MIQALLFDLDNTLYPASERMEDDIILRMNDYTARITGLSLEAAIALRRERMPAYGTTLEWLMAEYGFDDPDAYFDYVHPEGEEEALYPDDGLAPFLDSLPQHKYIFTNAPMEHAERVLRRLSIEGRFRIIFDIRFNGLRGKPHRAAVDRVLAAVRDDCGAQPQEALFIDDVPRYVQGFRERGGHGVLIDQDGRHGPTGLPTIRLLPELGPLMHTLG
jgi:putative hydrolase of the HAD superfamily